MNFYYLINAEIDNLSGQIVSVIGGGGKSTLIQQIGKELVEKNLKVILTSTTKIQPLREIELVCQKDQNNYKSKLKDLLAKDNIVLLANDFYKGNKLVGIQEQSVPGLINFADTVLIEADGARQRSLKTHKVYEPVIPEISTSVIIICGANVVGAPLNEDNVHRAELFSQKWGLPTGTLLTPEIITKELLSNDSYLKYIPKNTAVSILINKADTNPEGAKLLARELKQKSEFQIYIGSILKNYLDRL